MTHDHERLDVYRLALREALFALPSVVPDPGGRSPFLLVRERGCRLPAQRSAAGGECLRALKRLALELLADRLV